jgi:hypothetical protein
MYKCLFVSVREFGLDRSFSRQRERERERKREREREREIEYKYDALRPLGY